MALIDEVIYFSVILAILVSTIVGLIAGRGKVKDVKDWVIAGGTFGAFLLWFLMGSEIYTDFTYLGLAGFTYTYGAPIAYNFLTNGLAYMFGFMLLPIIWIFSRKFNVITEADYFEKRYGSKYLEVIVALVGVLALAGYLDLNITAIGIILTSGTGHVTSTQIIEAKIIGFLLVTVFIYVSGIRGSAWNAIIKDILMFSTIFIIFITVPFIFFHGYGNFFHEITVKIPKYLVLPGAKHNYPYTWFISTVLLTALGQWMWPHWFSASLTSKSPKSVARTSIFMPIYQLVKLMVVFIGLGAILLVPGLKDGDYALLKVVELGYPLWFFGLVAFTATLSALIPGSTIIVNASSLAIRNIVKPFTKNIDDKSELRLSRAFLFIFTTVALVLAIFFPSLLVIILLTDYDFVAQFFPGVVIGLFWDKINHYGVTCGLLAGISLSLYLIIYKANIMDLNAGFIALLVNIMVTIVISLITSRFVKSKTNIRDILKDASELI